MLRRFGPLDLFVLTDKSAAKITETMAELLQRGQKSRARGWKVFVQHSENIRELTLWAFENRKQITREFPSLKSGEFCKNRHLIIREYGENATSKPQSLSSRGFEGTNFRLVITSDNDRQLKCRFGEYLNLSGTPLKFREGYPKEEKCAFCDNSKLQQPCNICGNWHCQQCTFKCEICGNEMCVSCATPKKAVMSAHEWYYHRK